MTLKIILENLKENKPFYYENCFPTLVSWQELATLINLRPFMSDSRVRILGPEAYEWVASEWTTDANTFPSSILESELKKYVFYIRDCSRINYQVNEICKEIENLLNLPVDVHLYFSLIEDITISKHGFGIHRDKIDVLIVQSEGISNFKLWDKNDDPQNSKPIIDQILAPGSVVFIPSGFWHEVISKSKRISLSFAFGNKNGAIEDRKWIVLP